MGGFSEKEKRIIKKNTNNLVDGVIYNWKLDFLSLVCIHSLELNLFMTVSSLSSLTKCVLCPVSNFAETFFFSPI